MPAIDRPHDRQRWDRLGARAWASMAAGCELDRTGVAVEVGPGFSTKVGLWLQRRGFEGTLFLVEPNRTARIWSVARYRELLPRAAVIAVDRPLADAPSVLPARLDVVLMNHVIDDLILSARLPAGRHETLFGSMRSGACADEVRSAWRMLVADRGGLAAASESAIEDIRAFCARVQPRLVVISQYRSWFHAHYGLDQVDRATAPLLAPLRVRLSAAVPGLDVRLRGTGPNRRRWLVGVRPPPANRTIPRRTTRRNALEGAVDA